MLLFKKKFLDAIRNGQKTQTIRLWKHRRMKAGQRSYIPGAGYIFIDSIDIVQFDQLTEEDAVRDGFETLAELLEEIEYLYPPGTNSNNNQPYRIRFHLLTEEQAKPKTAI